MGGCNERNWDLEGGCWKARVPPDFIPYGVRSTLLPHLPFNPPLPIDRMADRTELLMERVSVSGSTIDRRDSLERCCDVNEAMPGMMFALPPLGVHLALAPHLAERSFRRASVKQGGEGGNRSTLMRLVKSRGVSDVIETGRINLTRHKRHAVFPASRFTRVVPPWRLHPDGSMHAGEVVVVHVYGIDKLMGRSSHGRRGGFGH